MPPKRQPSPSPSNSSSGSSEEASSSSSEDEVVPPPQQKQAPEKKEKEESSDEEEDDDESSDKEESSPKPTPKPDVPKPKEAAAAASAAAKPSASDSGSDSESASSDSDAKPPQPPPPRRPSRGPDPSIKPISSKPMDGTPKSKASSVPQGSAEKRKRKEPEAAADDEEAPANGQSGKKLFQRVWTDDDEIAVLKGMIQAKNRGDEPESAIDDFLKSIHKTLHSEFSKTQLADKMRRLKKKYETNRRRSKKGADPTFTKAHEQAVFDLSKKIWGGDVARDYGKDDMEVDNTGKDAGKKARKSGLAPVVTSPRKDGGSSAVARGSSLSADGKEGEGGARTFYPKLRDAVALLVGENGGNLLGGSLSEALDLLKPETAKALEKKWDNHFMAGLKYFLERSKLKEELLKSLVEAVENA